MNWTETRCSLAEYLRTMFALVLPLFADPIASLFAPCDVTCDFVASVNARHVIHALIDVGFLAGLVYGPCPDAQITHTMRAGGDDLPPDCRLKGPDTLTQHIPLHAPYVAIDDKASMRAVQTKTVFMLRSNANIVDKRCKQQCN